MHVPIHNPWPLHICTVRVAAEELPLNRHPRCSRPQDQGATAVSGRPSSRGMPKFERIGVSQLRRHRRRCLPAEAWVFVFLLLLRLELLLLFPKQSGREGALAMWDVQ